MIPALNTILVKDASPSCCLLESLESAQRSDIAPCFSRLRLQIMLVGNLNLIILRGEMLRPCYPAVKIEQYSYTLCPGIALQEIKWKRGRENVSTLSFQVAHFA